MLHSPGLKEVFKVLAEYPVVAAAICRAISEGKLQGEKSLKHICTAAHIPRGQSFLVERVLLSGQSLGIFKQCSSTFWSVSGDIDFSSLALMLEGASLYIQEVSHPSNMIDVVLTLPPNPSLVGAALSKVGFRSAFIHDTQEIFSNLAISAENRFLVMTPFLDADGGAKLLELFRKVAPAVKKQLIIRCTNGVPPMSLQGIVAELEELNVVVANYWLPKGKPGAYETFHAKVILADSSRCYIGSANMTQASLAVSMELGFLVEGEAATKIGLVCDSILQITNQKLVESLI